MPNPPDLPPQPPRRPYRAVVLKTGAGLGLVIALGGVAVAIWGRHIINAQVVPIIEEKIEEAIERPVELGKLERLSFNGIRVGKSILPAIETDDSWVSADTVLIDFDLRSLLFQKTFKPDIVLVRPNVSLVQQADGQWLEISVPESSEEEALITTEIQSVKLQDAQVSLTPFIQDPNVIIPRESLNISNINLDAEFYGEASQQVYFELIGDVDRGRFNVEGEADLEQQAIKANVRSQQLPAAGINNLLPSLVGLKSGTLNSNLTVAAALADDGGLDQTSVDVQGTAQFQNGEVLIRDLAEPIRNIRAQMRFKGQQVTLEKTGLQLGDVELLADGTVDWEAGYDLKAQIPEVSVRDVQTLAALELPENLPVDTAVPFELTTRVTGPLNAPEVQGRLANLAPLQVDKVSLATAMADFVLPLTEFKLEEFELTELRIVPDVGGLVLAQGQADLRDLQDPSFILTGTADLPADRFAQLYGTTLPPETVIGQLTASLEAEGTLETQTAFAQWQLSESTFPGQGELTLADNRLVVDNTQLRVADGTVTANGIAQLDSGDWQAALATTGVPVEKFTTQAQGLLSANLDAAGNLFELDLAKIEATGEAAIANAVVRIPNLDQPLLDPGDWTTAFQWQGDRIAVETFTAPGVEANGTIGVDLKQSVPISNFDLNVTLQQFDLQPLNELAPQPVGDYAQLAGLTSFDGQLTGTLANPQLVGEARLDQLTLNDLAFETLTGPIAFSLAEGGSLDLSGQQDRLQLSLDSRFWPASFNIRNQEFVAQGYGQGRQLHVDIVQLPLAKLGVRPVDGFGRVAGLLTASIDADLADFSNPVASGEVTIVEPALNPIDAQQFAATFRYADNTVTLDQGELLLDNSRYLLTGSASLKPQLQYTGQITAAEGRIEDLVALVEKIDPSVFNLGDFSGPEGNAADLAVQPARLPTGSLLEQLKAFAAFVASQPESVDESQQLVISPLTDLSGGFTGTIAIAADSPNLDDIQASFDLQGNSWQWGPYAPANQFVVQGDIQQLNVNLDSFLIKAEDTTISLSGQGNPDQLAGQLTVDNLPVALADYIYPLPVTAAGELDMFAQFDGSLTNPEVEGRAIVVDPQINGYPIEQVETAFNYKNASLDVAGDIAIDPGDAPITLRGSIPYALPFMTVRPATERLAIKAVVPDDSFDVINTLTQDQVRWEAGSGEVVVQVDGTLKQPVVMGSVKLRDGVVGSEFLADPVTDLTGDIQFDLALLEGQFPLSESNIPLATGGLTIAKLQANVQDGQLTVNGELPLSPFDQLGDGIKIALEALPVDYSGVVKSVFDGQITIDGSVIAPVVGGNLAIGAGRISTFELANQFRGSDNAETDIAPQPVDEFDGPIARQMAKAVALYREDFFGEETLIPESDELPLGLVGQLVSFNDFEIQLSDRLLIAGQPLFNLRASGDIVVDGALANPRPEGEIALESGWINLFSTQFRLDRGEENKATFVPGNGIYPILNTTMRTRVQETDTPRVPAISESGFVSSEITENQNIDALGSVEYITIRASVADLNARDLAQGSLEEAQDQLGQAVILESDPSRSQGELVALLGNNVFSGITSAGLTQLAGFVGAGNVVGFLNNLTDALGFQSFSVFPTTDTATDSTVGIGIGVEAIFEITDDVNVSVLEILNNGNAPQFGLQYELTEELRLRGSSNLDDTEFRLEYRFEF